MQSNLLRVFRPHGSSFYLSYILFADDCLLIARATVRDAMCLKAIIDTYCSLSGQQVNLTKSQIIFSPSTVSTVRAQIKVLFYISAKRGSCKYLGVPITSTRFRPSDFIPLVENLHALIAGWK